MIRRLSFLILCLGLAFPSLGAGTDPLASATRSVEEIRLRQFIRPVESRVLKRSDLRPYLLDQIAHTSGSAENYRQQLEFMQLVDHDPKLIDRLLDLYEAQVLAFYDPETHVYFSLDSPPPGLPAGMALDDVVAVHELTHALQDQLFEAGRTIGGLQNEWDRELAYHSVLEGEAMLVMIGQIYRQLGQPLDELLKNDALINTLAGATELTTGIPAETPKYLVDSMKFPYLDGLRLVIAAYRRDGWKGVDGLHQHPPISSEEVLHSDLYFARVASGQAVSDAPLDRQAWFSTHLGEFFWRELVGADASKGADGSLFTIRRDGKNRLTAFVDTRWDSDDEAEHFASAYERFLYGRGIHPLIRRSGRQVKVSYGADARSGRKFIAR